MIEHLQHSKVKQTEERKSAVEKKKELLPRKVVANTNPWKDANNHTYYCDDDIKRIPAKMLPNMVIYRMNMVPRSYDERVFTEVHDKGFKLASNSIGEFGNTDAEFLTQLGKN